jgi:S-adenosylmethionine:tRNA ribosyltransferase-isomerase
LGEGFSARIVQPLFGSQRAAEIEFEGENLWSKIFKFGRPIQYSYLTEALELWDQQTIFSGPPVSLEPPSSAFCLTWGLIQNLKAKGVGVVSITHSTGLSSTGEERLDRLLPLTETSWISEMAAETILNAKNQGRRVIAVGTGVARALEGIDELKAGRFEVSLKIDRAHRRRLVDGLLTGLHEKSSSHLDLLKAFVHPDVLRRAYLEAEERNYLIHEFGDVNLIL